MTHYTHEIVDTRNDKIVARGFGEDVARDPDWMMNDFLDQEEIPANERKYFIVREIPDED